MTSPDLHPEELLDRAASSALSDAEATSLDAHLAACPVCRFELAARRDFAASASVDAGTIDALVTDDLVTRALAGVATWSPRRRVRGRSATLIAAALSVMAVSSFAAVGVSGTWPKLVAFVEATIAPTPTLAPSPVPTRAAPVPAPVPVPVPVPVSTPASTLVEPPSPPPQPVLPPPSRAARPEPRHREERAQVSLETPELVRVTRPSPPEVRPDAGALFVAASRARARGEWPIAISGYHDLVEHFPTSDEAVVSHAALGRLLLDTGDAGAAIVELDAYLATSDVTLREEVLVARALACGRLGRTQDEAASWTQLLERYPESMHAPRARERLSKLSR